jgi:hypothetical protein
MACPAAGRAEETMEEHVPSPEALRRAQVFWQQAQQDVKSAAKRHQAGKHLESGYLSFQGAINALTVVCYLHGRFQVPNFSAVKMASLCQDLDARFEALQPACVALEQVQEHSPFQPAAEPAVLVELSRASLAGGRTVLETVRGYLKEQRRRFFAP